MLPYTTFHLREFFNREPEFTSEPETTAAVGDEYIYEITATDPDPYDTLTIIAYEIPDWLTLTENGDGTATLSGTPVEMGDDAVIAKINIDEEQDLAVKFGVRSIPAIFVLKDGEIVESFSGVKDKSTLVNSLKSV